MANVPGAGARFGRFVVDEILGRGGMGVVYRAHDPVIGRSVAIKVLHIPAGSDRDEVEARSRFEQEFRSAGTLSHPSLVTIYDVGEQDGLAYIAMECVEGESLDKVLRSGRELSFGEIAEIAMDLCRGLDYAHRAGVVHRDIKPANILIAADGRPKITDFGVAKVMSSNLTQTGTVVGTPSYMAPEQVTSQGISGQSDQFAVGVILYQMITGELPFDGDIPTTVLYRIVHEEPKPPHEVNPELPPAIDGALLRALAKKPRDRYPTCTALAEAVREALGATPQIPEESRQRTVTLSGEALPVGSGTYDGALSWWQRRSGGPRLSLLAAALVAVGVLGWFGVSAFVERNPESELARLLGRGEIGGEAATGSDVAATPPGTPPGTTEDAGPEANQDAVALSESDPDLDASGAGDAPELRTFTVESEPAGARVLVDGEAVAGATPVEIELAVGSRYDIRVEKEGFVAQGSSDMAPEDREEGAVLRYELPPVIVPGTLVFDAGYDPVAVVAGRSYRGRELRLPPGEHEVVVAAPSVYYPETRHSVTIRSGERAVVGLPATVSVQVSSVPENATVAIDGGEPIAAPARIEIVPGAHLFRFEWPDGATNEKLQAIGRTGGRLLADATQFNYQARAD